MSVPSPLEMFDGASRKEAVERFEDYKAALTASQLKTAKGEFRPAGERFEGYAPPAAPTAELDAATETLTKALGADVVASIQGQLDTARAAAADLTKDLTVTSPLSTGFVPFDLEAPAKLLLPRNTPIRNELPRGKGQGSARKFKRITGVSNLGVGGVANMSSFFNSETTTNTFGGVTGLRRPPKIAYAADEKTVGYVEQGLSDSLTWKAQYEGQGFQDMRSLSQNAVLWSTMHAEERNLLYGRGSGTGYVGALTAPSGVTAVASSGGALASGTVYYQVTAVGGFGETTPIAEQSVSVTSNQKVTITIGTEPAGAVGYNIYASSTTGTEVFQGTTGSNVFVLSTLATGTAAVPGANTSADANGYDGLLTVALDPTQSGYVKRINATWGTSNPGVEFQTAFTAMWNTNRADPDEVWTYAGGRVGLSDLLKTASSTGYRITLDSDGSGGHQLGTLVTGIQNETTGKMVDFKVHPFMPTGAALIRSTTLPIPDSDVAATSEVINVQDYMAVEWPNIQMTYDVSTYILGTLVHYAPAWSGAIVGIQN